MNQKKKTSIEEEIRSSQIYKTLSDTGIVNDQVAGDIGKAVESVGSVVGQFASGVVSEVTSNVRASKNYSRGVPNPPPYQQAAPYQTGPASGGSGQNPGTQPPVHQEPSPQTPPPVQENKAPSQQSPQLPMKMVREPGVAKFYITAATALLYALNFPLYQPYHFAIFAVVEILIFLISSQLFKGKKVFVPIEPEKKEEPKEEEEKKEKVQLDPEVEKIVREGRAYLKELREANDAIPDEALSDCIDRMERASADIFLYIADNPEKAPQIRKFMNYYLPTTLKLLDSYQRLSAQSVKGENITSAMFNIAGMMHTVADAFEKQLDALFSAEAMDISADITVFEAMLSQEGFVEQKEKKVEK